MTTVRRLGGGYDALGPRWASLVRDAVANGAAGAPFTGPEFGQVWWSIFAAPDAVGRPADCQPSLQLIGLESDDGDLVAALPLQRCGDTVMFAGDHEISDYLGPTVLPGYEAALIDILLDELDAAPASSADLRGLPHDSPLPTLLPDAAQARGWLVESSDEAVCPTIDVAGGWDAYLDRLRSRDRRETRRKLRPLRQLRGAVALESWTQPDDVRDHLPDLLAMMADSRADKAEFLTDPMTRFFQRLAVDLADAGWLRLYQMSIAGAPAAMVLCFEAGGELLLYNSGFDPRFRDISAGLGSKVLCIRDAVERGLQRVNFLRGDEPYKFQLGAEAAVVQRLQLRRPSS